MDTAYDEYNLWVHMIKQFMDTAYDEYNLWIQLMMNTIYGYNL